MLGRLETFRSPFMPGRGDHEDDRDQEHSDERIAGLPLQLLLEDEGHDERAERNPNSKAGVQPCHLPCGVIGGEVEIQSGIENATPEAKHERKGDDGYPGRRSRDTEHAQNCARNTDKERRSTAPAGHDATDRKTRQCVPRSLHEVQDAHGIQREAEFLLHRGPREPQQPGRQSEPDEYCKGNRNGPFARRRGGHTGRLYHRQKPSRIPPAGKHV
jgi:hypothetical protein